MNVEIGDMVLYEPRYEHFQLGVVVNPVVRKP